MSTEGPPATLDGTAFLFPGQGSQTVGMGRAFYDNWPEMRMTFDRLDTAIDIDLREMCFEGTQAEIRRVSNIQPLLLATGVSVYEAVQTRFSIKPALMAGHSLGHFSALAASEALDPVATVSLTHERGQCMERAAAADGPGTMISVLLSDPETVENACAARDDVDVALYNGPKQTVISGTTEGVASVRATLERRTRARFRELDVGGAFHSPVMASAVDCVEDAMTEVTIREAKVPIVSDVTGDTYTDPNVARRDLTTQVTSSVDWVRAVEQLREQGIDRFVEFPPAGVLSNLVERIAPQADCITLETPEDALEAFA